MKKIKQPREGNLEWINGNSPKGPGRPKGKKNRLTNDVVQNILTVFDELQKVKGKSLLECATEDPAWFYSIFYRGLVPKNISLDFGEKTEALAEKLTRALERAKNKET